MNHKILTIAMAFAAVAAVSCNKDNQPAGPETISGDFSVKATIADVSWAENASLALFHSADDALVSDGEFKLSGDVFKGSLAEAIEDGKEYEWIAASPYTAGAELSAYPVELDGTAAPLFGKVTAAASKTAAPEIAMTSLAAYVKVACKNVTSEKVTVSSYGLEAQEANKIAGKYTVDLTAEVPLLNAVEETNVVNAEAAVEIPAGETVTLVIPVAPVTFAKGAELKIKVNGLICDKVTFEEETVLSAGAVKEFSVDVKPVGLYIMGDALEDGWNWADSEKFTETSSNVFEWTGHLNWVRNGDGPVSGNLFRFVKGVNWHNEQTTYFPVEAYEVNTTSIEMKVSDEKSSTVPELFAATAPGKYKVTLDLNKMTVAIEVVELDDKYSDVTAIHLTGSQFGWGEGPALAKTSGTDVWTWTGTLDGDATGDNKLINFLVDSPISDRWCALTGSYGYVSKATPLQDRIFKISNYTGLISIKETAEYTITMNVAKRTVSIVAK